MSEFPALVKRQIIKVDVQVISLHCLFNSCYDDVQVISVLSIVFVSISIVGMTINTLPKLQYQVSYFLPSLFEPHCPKNKLNLHIKIEPVYTIALLYVASPSRKGSV